MIQPGEIVGVDAMVARRVIATARSIAPCINSIEGEFKEDAIAILTAIAVDGVSRGSRHIRAQRIGPAGVDYREINSWFSPDDKDALRALCSQSETSRDPIGDFPTPSKTISAMWPNE